MSITSSGRIVFRLSGVTLANSTRSRDGMLCARAFAKLVTAGLENPSGDSRPSIFCDGILMVFKCGNFAVNPSKYEIYKSSNQISRKWQYFNRLSPHFYIGSRRILCRYFDTFQHR
jgi:hypothetical protein